VPPRPRSSIIDTPMLLERLLDNLSISVNAFASCRVAHGWRLRLPALDWVTLHYVSQGEGEVRNGAGEPTKLRGGSLAVIPPHLLHSLQCGHAPFGEVIAGAAPIEIGGLPAHLAGPNEDDGLVVVCGKMEVTYAGGLGLFDHLDEILVLDFSDEPTMPGHFETMSKEIASGRPGASAMTTSLMRQCLISVFRELCTHDSCELSWLRALDDPSMSRVLEIMLAHPEQPHTVASLAEKAYLSRSAFARRFRTSFGRPPLEYLRGVRLRHAAQLLKQSPPLPIVTVAHRSGFSSRSQFSRAFRTHFGTPPAAFRA
jgi:AraC-like DNA-binding protein